MGKKKAKPAVAASGNDPGIGPEALEDGEKGFSELLHYTLPGYLAGLVLGLFLDQIGLQRSGWGQWLVRTITGEGERLLEGIYALRQRMGARAARMAESYGWGKLLGLTVPWWIDLASRGLGVDVYGVEGFYLPFF